VFQGGFPFWLLNVVPKKRLRTNDPSTHWTSLYTVNAWLSLVFQIIIFSIIHLKYYAIVLFFHFSNIACFFRVIHLTTFKTNSGLCRSTKVTVKLNKLNYSIKIIFGQRLYNICIYVIYYSAVSLNSIDEFK